MVPTTPTQSTERQQRFLALYLPISDRLARFARAMTSNVDEAMDVEAETVLIALERFDSVRTPGAFLSFVFTIARRVATHRRERSARFRPLEEGDSELFPSHDPSPEVAADIRILYDTLAQLPDKIREAVIMFEISGLSLEDIRDIQGGTLSGVKSRLKRGREKLTRLLRERREREVAPNDFSATFVAVPIELQVF